MSIFKSFKKQSKTNNTVTLPNHKNEFYISFNKYFTSYLSTHHISELEKCIETFFKIPSEKIRDLPMVSTFSNTLVNIFIKALNPITTDKLNWLIGTKIQSLPDGQELFKCLHDLAQFGSGEILTVFDSNEFVNKITDLYSFLIQIEKNEYSDLLSLLMSMIILIVPPIPKKPLPSGLLVLRFDKPDIQIYLLPVFQTITHAHMDPELIQVVAREESVQISIKALEQAKPNNDTLRLVESYLSFVKNTALLSDAILNCVSNNGFYDVLLILLIESDKELIAGVDGVLDVIAPLMFFGDFTPTIPINDEYNNTTRILANRYPYFLVRNKYIPLFLQNYLLKTNREEGKLHTMKIIERIYRENPMNYLVLHSINYTPKLYSIFDQVSQPVRDVMLSLCVYLSRCQKFVPYNEIETITTHLTIDKINKHPELVSAFDYLTNQLLIDSKEYQKIFEQTGMTINAITVFIYFATHSNETNQSIVLQGMITLITRLMNHSVSNFTLFKETTAMTAALSLFKQNINLRRDLTKLFTAVIEYYDPIQTTDLLKKMIEPLETDPSPIILLKCVCAMLYRSSQVKESFRQLGGFEFYKRLYKYWNWSLESIPTNGITEDRYSFIEYCFVAMIYAMKGSKDNRKHFDETFKNGELIQFIQNSPFLNEENKSKYSERMTCLLIAIIFEIPDIDKVQNLGIFTKPVGGVLVYHPFVLHSLIRLIRFALNVKQQQLVLKFLTLTSKEDINVRKMSFEHIATTLIKEFKEDITKESDLHNTLLELLNELIAYGVEIEDVSVLMKSLKEQPYDEGVLKCLLNSTIKADRNGALSFNTAPNGYSCLSIPVDTTQFPLQQWSITTWVNLPPVVSELSLFQIYQNINGSEQSFLQLIMNPSGLRVIYGSKVIFDNMPLPRKWNHIVLVGKGKKITLYINGLLKSTAKLINYTPTPYRCVIGHSKENKVIPNAVFKIGPLKMLEYPFSDQQIRELYLLGEMYQGSFQTIDYSRYEVLPNYDSNDINVIQSFTNIKSLTYSTFNLNIPEQSIIINTDRILTPYALNSCIAFGTVNLASPHDITDGIYKVGGIALLLALILKSDTKIKFDLSLKLLLYSLRKSEDLFEEMKQCHGFDLLNLFIYRKPSLVTTESIMTLLLFSGVDPTKKDSAVISSPNAFDILILDFSLFHRMEDPQTTFLFILQSFVSLIYNNKYAQININILRSLHFLSRLIDLFQDDTIDDGVIQIIINLLQYFLLHSCTGDDLKLLVRLLIHFISVMDDKQSTSLLIQKSELRCISLIKLINFLSTNLKDKTTLLSIFTPSILFHMLSLQSLPINIVIAVMKLCASFMAVGSQTKQLFVNQFNKEKGIIFINFQLPRCTESIDVVYVLLALITCQVVPDIVSDSFEQYQKMPFSTVSIQSPEYISSLLKLLRFQIVQLQVATDSTVDMMNLVQFTGSIIRTLMEQQEIATYVFNECLNDYISILVDKNGYFKMGHPLEPLFQRHIVALGNAFAFQMVQIGNKNIIAHELLYENSSFLRDEEEEIFMMNILQAIGNSVLNQFNGEVNLDRVAPIIATFVNGRVDFILTNITPNEDLVNIMRDVIKYIKIAQLSGKKTRSIYPLYEALDRIILLLFDRRIDSELESTLEIINKDIDIIFNDINYNEQFIYMLLHSLIRNIYQTNGTTQQMLSTLLSIVSNKRGLLISRIFQTKIKIIEWLNSSHQMTSKQICEWLLQNKDEMLKADNECLLKQSTQWITDESGKLALVKGPIEQRRKDRIILNEQSEAQRIESIRRIQQKNRQVRARVSVLLKDAAEQRNEHFRALHAQSQGVWESFAECLFLENGIWHKQEEGKWTLDNVEGPCRMRKRLIHDTDFFERYKTKEHDGYIDVQLKERHQERSYELPEYLTVMDDIEVAETFSRTPNSPMPDFKDPMRKRRASTATYEDDLYNMMKTTVETSTSNLNFVEKGDEIKSKFNCNLVVGMNKLPGIFVVCTQSIYIVQGLELRREVLVAKGIVKTERIPSEDIQNIASRRFMLRNIAVEIFTSTGRNKLIVFEEGYEAVIKALSPFRQKEADMTSGIHEEKKRLVPLKLFNQVDPMTQKWIDGKISNFHYLMYLNTKAGRTFNDVTQYPVMPWVISDYSSQELDLKNPHIYRDLSKPIGALTPERAENTLERYEAVKDNPEMAFHYGSHYTSVGVTLYYLIRCEPFSHFGIELQGGKFDRADRLFNSLEDLWKLLTGPTVKQVMELIPEFFYFPEFLKNFDHFDLKKRNEGTIQVDNVVLPPWAKGSYRKFVRTNMMALESPIVSQHLNEWIDLIFGFKQTGEPAIKALNLFHPSSYEGGIDMKNVDDPKLKAAYEDMIINFGQTPIQLFKQPHPKRNTLKTLFTYGILLSDSWNVLMIKNYSYPIKAISVSVQNFNGLASGIPIEKGNKVLNWNEEGTLSIYQNGKVLGVIENVHPPGKIVCSVCGNIVITGGQAGMICVFDCSVSLKQIGRIRGHKVAVTALCISKDYSIIVSGDEMGCISIWDLHSFKIIRSFEHHACITLIKIQHETGEIVTVSDTDFKHWTINGELIQRAELSQVPTDAYFARIPEWIPCHVFITSHKDGSIKVWRLDETLCLGNGSCNTHEHTPKLLKTCSVHSSEITCFTIADDFSAMYVGYADGLIQKLV
ncbi:hypothetical protein ENUP19_0020G0023 [Entamoeba nuttalli]|uniref:Beige/BEACH domain containing protein n=1 Tax=Entamoeba nuttalli TaxID=412467 RepID=A0ABQ0D952_9EUKA